MDLLFAPKTDSEKGLSTRYRFRYYSSAKTKAANYEYNGFCYVGRNTAHIEKLVSIYMRGYAFDSLENARNELLRKILQEGSILPEFIICQAGFDLSEMRSFMAFLRTHKGLEQIPFVLEGSRLSERELLQYRRDTRPDEILILEAIEAGGIRNKVQFLRKVKAHKSKVGVPQIEERMGAGAGGAAFSKRIFDILVAGMALLVLSPIFLLIAVWIKLESKGPVFYISKRAGRGYKIFDFYKFRTMVVDADKKMRELTHLNQYSPGSDKPVFFKINDDPRITRVGKMLRNTSLDELPQLINVLLGHMSLVGNRPLPLYEAQVLTTDDYAARFLAPAGITGLWQVKKRGNKDMSAEERINIDIMYAEKCNFATDLWIIANTPSALLQKANV